MAKLLFLPGAGGSSGFWKPAGDRLPAAWSKHYFGWPGLGDQPHDPAIKGIDDLVQLVTARIDGPVGLVAQSKGGVIAVSYRQSDVPGRGVLQIDGECRNVTDHQLDTTGFVNITGDLNR